MISRSTHEPLISTVNFELTRPKPSNFFDVTIQIQLIFTLYYLFFSILQHEILIFV